MARPRHPKKAIESEVASAIRRGWTLRMSDGHAWGVLWCPAAGRDGCWISVYSTPKDPENFAKKLRRYADRCPHTFGEQ